MRTITREQAIHDIRAELVKHVDDEHSICDVAAREHIFCGGFAHWTFTELKKLHPQIVRSRRRITPAELRDLANRWQLARQYATQSPLACDTQLHEKSYRLCRGWDEFSLEQLAGFHASLCHEEVEIVGDKQSPTSSKSSV